MTQNIISLNITDPRGAGGHAMWTAFLVVLLAWPVLGWGKEPSNNNLNNYRRAVG